MLFSAPVPFREALRSRAVKRIMPTHLSSAELEQLSVQLRERAMFSARVLNEQFLQRTSDAVASLLNPVLVTRPDGTTATEGLDLPTARLQLKELLREIGYVPTPEDAGTIKDLRTDGRLNLILETNTEMAQGYGWWAQGQDPDVLDQWPAQEMIRAVNSREKRPWLQRWRDAGGRVFPGRPKGYSLTDGAQEGRLVALKDDPIWEAISRFGQPYPPFDFNSGIEVADVSRSDAIALGLIDRDTQVTPQSRGFDLATN